MDHDENCPKSGKWYSRRECREFSTDGTALGADIAHSVGTMDEKEIQQRGVEEFRRMFDNSRHLTGMDEEQADWEASQTDWDEKGSL